MPDMLDIFKEVFGLMAKIDIELLAALTHPDYGASVRRWLQACQALSVDLQGADVNHKIEIYLGEQIYAEVINWDGTELPAEDPTEQI